MNVIDKAIKIQEILHSLEDLKTLLEEFEDMEIGAILYTFEYKMTREGGENYLDELKSSVDKLHEYINCFIDQN